MSESGRTHPESTARDATEAGSVPDSGSDLILIVAFSGDRPADNDHEILDRLSFRQDNDLLVVSAWGKDRTAEIRRRYHIAKSRRVLSTLFWLGALILLDLTVYGLVEFAGYLNMLLVLILLFIIAAVNAERWQAIIRENIERHSIPRSLLERALSEAPRGSTIRAWKIPANRIAGVKKTLHSMDHRVLIAEVA